MDEYTLLGRTGLRVSPLCLGAMTFGNGEGWLAGEHEARKIFDGYLEAGGNFIDTANIYANGESEEMLGRFLASSGRREQVVLASKFSLNTAPGDPNAGGNGRNAIYRALDASLKRLRTDYLDLYWLHAWDTITPIEEVVETLDDLVRSGKIRYVGLSDVPAWIMARAQTYAELRGRTRVAALQVEYSLLDRTVEIEHTGACSELGLGICAWGPLGAGLLTGKYRQVGRAPKGRIAKDERIKNRMLTERNLEIVEVVAAVAAELGRPPAQVALNWVTQQREVSSTIIGATQLEQLEENLAALNFTIPDEFMRQLDEISRPLKGRLYDFFEPPFQQRIHGAKVSRKRGRPT
ncbi:MAG: aldo/keto reductase [Hyphomonadaceae bacterium]|nr:aldo/keto reductase [Hyphomonadaceae bacterium]